MISLPTRLDLLKHVAKPGMIVSEIGVLEGDFSIEIQKALSPFAMVLVDLWDAQDASIYPGGYAALSKVEHQNHYKYVCERFFKYPNVSVVRMPSVSAADMFYPKYFDFVYIDANHSYEAVKADIECWWPLVKDGGWFCGHDYTGMHKGVKKAVDEFLVDRQFKLDILTEEFEQASWGVHKPE